MKRNMWIGIVALVVVIGLIWWYNSSEQKLTTRNRNNASSDSLADVLPVGASGDVDIASTTEELSSPNRAVTVSAAKAYTDAIAMYKNRIQFSNCHGIVNLTNTGTMSIKHDEKFMLDNRDATAHTIAFASQSYKIPAYGFVIATAKPPGTHNLTCDGGGAAVVNVE